MTPFIWNAQNRETHIDLKQIGGWLGLGGEGVEEVVGDRKFNG